MRVRKLMLGGLMAVLLVSMVGCGSDSDEGKVLGANKKAADLVVTDTFPFYNRSDLKIPLNQEVTFTVFNDGKDVHNVTIPGFAIDMDVEPKKSVTIKIPAASAAPRDGFYTVYCKFHQTQGEATRLNIAK